MVGSEVEEVDVLLNSEKYVEYESVGSVERTQRVLRQVEVRVGSDELNRAFSGSNELGEELKESGLP